MLIRWLTLALSRFTSHSKSGRDGRALTFLILLAHIACIHATRQMPDLSKIPTPPSFIHQRNKKVLYFFEQTSTNISSQSDSIKRFNCEVSAHPPAEYRWQKDNIEFSFDDPKFSGRIIRYPGTGSFAFNKFSLSDAGAYRCSAENDNGTAIDDIIEYKESLMTLFEPQPPETIQINFGDSFKKDCVAPRSVPPARSYWVLQSAPGTERRMFRTINSTNIVVNDKGTIFFQYVTENDVVPNLFYTCMAENTELKDYKFGSQFTFKVSKSEYRKTLEPSIAPIEQYSSPSTLTVLKGDNLELFCVMSGFVDMIPRWSKDGSALNMSRVSWGTNFKKSMKLYNVVYNDRGTYRCDFDQSPHLSKSFDVSVEDAPYWFNDESPRSVNSSEGSTVEFNCTAGGKPTPVVRFFKNGKPITTSDRTTIYGSMLLLKKIRKDVEGAGDNAVYQCEVTNKHGSLWANFYLNILAFPPIILEDPGSVETVVGKKVILKCKVFGSPRPKEQWAHRQASQNLVNVQHYVEPVDDYGYSKLVLNSPKKSDSGEYVCSFKNLHGNDSTSGQLTVRERTALSAKPQSQMIAAGKRLTLPCTAAHDPSLEVSYSWLHYDQPIPDSSTGATSTNRVQVDPVTHSLIIDDVSGTDTGAYSCVAKTALDSVKETINITVKDVPVAPIQVRVKCAATVAEVSFLYPERPTVVVKTQAWVIQLNVDPQEPDAWDNYAGELYTLTGGFGKARVHLYPYGNFAFRVLARNEVGYSQPAYPSEYTDDGKTKRCATAPQKPPMNPLNVKVKGATPDSMVVSWDPVPRRDWYGPDFSYLIQYKEKGKGDDEYNNVTVSDPKKSEVTIDGLTTFIEYDVTVWSKNREGTPSVSPGVFSGFSGEDLPLAAPDGFDLKEIQGPSSATFVWKPVKASSIRGEFKGYKIEYWIASRKRDLPAKKEAYFDSQAAEGSIYDLTPNRRNFAQIRVHNNAGEGPASPVVSIEMPEGVPSAVRNLHAFPMSHSEIGIIWDEPSEFNGNLTDYVIDICVSNEAKCVQAVRVDYGKPQEVRIRDLQSETKYRVEVAARTSVGPGELSIADVSTAAENFDSVAPLEPTVENVKISNDHINVTWRPGDYTGKASRPPGDQFRFKYRVKDVNGWTVVNETSGYGPGKSGLSLSLKDLEPGTTYEIKAVSVHQGVETESRPYYYTTAGGRAKSTSSGWMIALIVIIILLIILLIVICLVVRNRGDKYSVSKKEKRQGREPMSKNEKAFGEYAKAPSEPDEEKASLTAEIKLESETDSMAEYGDGENGRFTEDGSFIGQYGPNKNVAFTPHPPPPDRGAENVTNVTVF